ncbi:hypothetical protein VE02_06609 [Pseudogymnoascus sp. 03VT05]|nr:hypothetical protein VE02_06609 [Pseudogymnoascus sp. 03VT05]
MPVPWMEDLLNFGSGNGEVGYYGGDGDSGYEGNGSNSVDGVEQVEGDEVMDDVALTKGEEEENSNDARDTIEEEIASTISQGGDQGSDNRNGDGNGISTTTAPNPEAASTPTTTTTCNNNQETEANAAKTTAAAIDHIQQPDSLSNDPTTATTPPTPTPLSHPSTTFTQVRHDIRSYFADLAERERLITAREKWVASRAEALWRNARVLGGILRKEVDRKEGKRALREFGGDDGGDEEKERGRKRTRRV